jgi:SAM-dependent methyltransferase
MKIENTLPKKLEKVMLKKESKEPCRVFVDIGSGVFPVAFVGKKEFKDNDYYVGVDRDKKKMKIGFPILDQGEYVGGGFLKNPENLSRVGKNVFFINETVHSIPFPDSSVDEVFLGNVLGEFAIHYVDDFLLQAQRILKPGGTLIVLEIVTPSVAENRDEEGVNNFVEKFGFKKIKEVSFGDPGFKKEVSKYALHQLRYLDGGEFIVYFKKVEPENLVKPKN